MVEIIENRELWIAEYEADWLKNVLETGEPDWKRYKRVRNKEVPAAPPVDLSESRLLLISTAGGYLIDEQEPYDIEDNLGDYTLRPLPFAASLDRIGFAHGHYDPAMIDADPQVALPLHHLQDMVEAGIIGEVAPTVASYMGYQPAAHRVVDEVFPEVMRLAREQEVDAALLIPV